MKVLRHIGSVAFVQDGLVCHLEHLCSANVMILTRL